MPAPTEHTEQSPYNALAVDILTNDLTPEQARSPRYYIREDKSITGKQRSTINAILRTNLGDAKVAYYIWNHGLPTLLDLPLRRDPPTKAVLHNMLEEFMTWHHGLLQNILERKNRCIADA